MFLHEMELGSKKDAKYRETEGIACFSNFQGVHWFEDMNESFELMGKISLKN